MNEVVWLVSYPRSGNTWVRLLLSAVQYHDKGDIGYKDIDRLAPDAHRFNLDELLAQDFERQPVFVKSHYSILPLYKRAVYMFRDGRDVLISDYYYQLWALHETEESLPFDKFFDKFLAGDVPFGSWKTHVSLWMFEKHGVEMLPLRYEVLWKDPARAVKSILEFACPFNYYGLGIINQAVELNSFERCSEKAKVGNVHPFKRGLVGRPGIWRGRLSEDQKECFWNWAGDVLSELGYSRDGEI